MIDDNYTYCHLCGHEDTVYICERCGGHMELREIATQSYEHLTLDEVRAELARISPDGFSHHNDDHAEYRALVKWGRRLVADADERERRGGPGKRLLSALSGARSD